MPSAQKPAGAEDAERALSRDQPVAADAAAPTPANQGSASAGAEFTDEGHHQDPPGNGDLLAFHCTVITDALIDLPVLRMCRRGIALSHQHAAATGWHCWVTKRPR